MYGGMDYLSPPVLFCSFLNTHLFWHFNIKETTLTLFLFLGFGVFIFYLKYGYRLQKWSVVGC